jgi:hypothetical protein
MRTKKISLTEFRKLVKNIIKEEASKKKIIRESWEGVDADNETSLFEYGFVAKQRPDKDYPDEWFVLYDAGNNKFDTGHIRETELDNIVLGKEWANEKDIQSLLKFVDSDRESWLQSSFVNKLSDLISYFGVENVMGSSYGGFSKEEAEQMLMQESVKPKTQKIKLSEVRQMVRKSLRENNQKKSNFPSSTEVNDLIKDLNLNKINGMYTKNGGAFSLEKKDDDKSKINMSIEKVKNFPSIKINYKNKSTVIGIPNGIITKGIKNKIKNILNESMDDPKSWGVGSFGITKDVDLSKKSFESLNDDQKTKENLLKRIEELSNQLHVSYAGNDDHHFEKQVLIHILKRKTRGNIKSITDEIIEDAILDVEEHYDFDIFD